MKGETPPPVYLTRAETLNISNIMLKMGLPIPSVNSIVRRMVRWEKHHGIKHVVDNLKKFKTDLQSPGSVTLKRHKDSSWKGDFRPVWRLAQKGRRGLSSAARILNIYGRWTAHTVSDKHVEEFVRCITTDEPPAENLKQVISAIMETITVEDYYLCREIGQKATFDSEYPLGPKGSVLKDLTIATRDTCSPLDHVVAATTLAPNVVNRHLELINKFCLVPPAVPSNYDIVGIVSGLTKDRGLKVRFVANPLTLFQRVLTRLKAACRDYLELSCPEQAVFDQEAGVKWVQQKLKRGVSMTCLDLKSCSDLLPARPQFSLLRELFPNLRQDIDLFEDISRADYIIQPRKQFVFSSWKVGQPLGAEPSFFSFTIFLIFLLRSCGGSATSFRVIGDDLVMEAWLTEAVTHRYQSMGALINTQKSIFHSNTFAEFAGRWIDKYGALPLYKASPMRLKSDPIGYIRQYGFKAIKLLPHRYRKMLGVLSLFPSPIGVVQTKNIFKRLPPKLANDLYAEKFKVLDTFEPFTNPEIFEKWASEQFPFGDRGLRELNSISQQFTSGKTRFQVNYAEKDYSFELLGPFTGCGVWSVQGTRAPTMGDFLLSSRRFRFNEKIKDSPIVAHHPADVEVEYKEIQPKTWANSTISYDAPKKPLRFYKKVWNKVKYLFRGSIRW